jgi:hypothetical protein
MFIKKDERMKIQDDLVYTRSFRSQSVMAMNKKRARRVISKKFSVIPVVK